jgi:hypothetical protein
VNSGQTTGINTSIYSRYFLQLTHIQVILQELRQALGVLQDMLVTSGAGALPLLPQGSSPLAEVDLLQQVTQAFNETWAIRTRNQEAAGMAANLLSADLASIKR